MRVRSAPCAEELMSTLDRPFYSWQERESLGWSDLRTAVRQPQHLYQRDLRYPDA